jgi:transposase-like protein
MTLKTLQDAFAYFGDPKNCIDYVVKMRWPDGKVCCPTCGSEAVTWLPTRSLFQCKGRHPKRQFSVKVGTLWEDSPIALGKWLIIGWILGSCRNGVSSYEVARTIGITQKSAWFMLHRLREGMKTNPQILTGIVEADESFVGGKVQNMHKSKRPVGTGFSKKAIGSMAKTMVLGLLERGGTVHTEVIQNRNKEVLHEVINRTLADDAILVTDEHHGYKGTKHRHVFVSHSTDGYVVNGRSTRYHTNSIENFWSCLKRMLKGTYISVSPKHLAAYTTEQAFRFNVRNGFTEQQRGIVLLNGILGKRLTYAALIAR